MRYSLAYVAAAVGSASATYLPAGYGGYGAASSSIPIDTAYSASSSSLSASYSYGTDTSSAYPTGTAPTHSSSASSHSLYSPSGYTHSSYPTESASYSYSPSGYVPPKSHPTGGYSVSSSTGYSAYLPSGSLTYSHPQGTGSYSHPYGTGAHHLSGSGSIPHGSGSGTPHGPITTPHPPITTVTHSTGTGTSTYTVTHTGTTTATETITTFVPCSSPVGTASGSTYYSTYLTVSYHTSTVTATTTEIEVVCPSTSVAAETPYAPVHNGYGAIPTSSLYGHPSPEYPASTHYGPGSKPTAGTCPPSETTVYSTIVVTETANAGAAPTECAECTTYRITLPNGQPTSVVVPPAGSNPTYGPVHPTSDAPYPTGDSPHYPIGSGTGTVSYHHPTGTALPSGRPLYPQYGYDRIV